MQRLEIVCFNLASFWRWFLVSLLPTLNVSLDGAKNLWVNDVYNVGERQFNWLDGS